MWKSIFNLSKNFIEEKSNTLQANMVERQNKMKLAEKLIEKQAIDNNLAAKLVEEQGEKVKLAAKLVEEQGEKVKKQVFQNFSKKFSVIILGSAVLYLAVDYVVHDCKYYLKYKIRKKFMDFNLKDPVSPIFERALPRYSQNVPTVFVGETGTGKTTLLGQILEDRQLKRLPTLLISLRVCGHNEVSGAPKMDSPNATLTSLFEQLMMQIGYPESPSMIMKFKISSIIWPKPTISSNDDIWRIRANRALSLLFEVASEIGQDAVNANHRPLIIIDEVLDLVRRDRYADVGGEEMMDRICGMTIRHNIDKKDVNVFMAGSSSLLLQELGVRRLHGINREIVTIKDPSEKDITQYLEKKLGYSPEACKRILERLGCRLRILSRVLESKLSDEELDIYINDCHNNAILDIKTLFATCSDINSRLQVSKILNDLSMEGKPVKVLEFSDLPLELQNHKIIKVFYVNNSLGIVIQRVPIRIAWLEIKNGDNFTI